jgi:osmotically-inducible protein OsmY
VERVDSQTSIDLTTSDGIAELEAHVQCRVGGQLRDFRVEVRGGSVVLRGHARTYHAKKQAENAVREMTAIPTLCNEIEVW